MKSVASPSSACALSSIDMVITIRRLAGKELSSHQQHLMCGCGGALESIGGTRPGMQHNSNSSRYLLILAGHSEAKQRRLPESVQTD